MLKEAEKPKGLLERLQRKREELLIKKQKGEQTLAQKFAAAGLGFAIPTIETVKLLQTVGGAGLPPTPEQLARRAQFVIAAPVVATALGTGAVGFLKGTKGLPKVGKVLLEEPEFATGAIGAEILQAVGLGKGLKAAGRAAETVGATLDPKFVKPIDDILSVPTSKGAKEIKLAGGVASTVESLKEQAKLAGKTVEAVSAQRGLFGRRTKEILVDKPLPFEGAPQLERSFFADPRGRLRQSRLGLVPEDGSILPKRGLTQRLIDSLTEDISFRKQAPQALIFPETPIAKLPRGIKKKLEAGQALTKTDLATLEKLQLTPTGEFKPIGFLGTESEITLAPGEVIVKKGKIGVTVLEGRKVTIFEAEIKAVEPGAPLITTASIPGRVPLSSTLRPVTTIDPLTGSLTTTKGLIEITTIPISFPSPKPSLITTDVSGATPEELSRGFVPPESISPPVQQPTTSPLDIPALKPLPSPRPSPPPPRRPRVPTPKIVSPPIKDDPVQRLIDSPSVKPSPPLKPKRPARLPPRSLIDTPRPAPTTPARLRFKREEKRRTEIFDVLIGRAGLKVFKKVEARSITEAIRIGKRGLKTTAAATLRIKPRGRLLTSTEESLIEQTLGSEFKKGKKKGKGIKFIQKRRFRIGTPGEKREITLLGIAASKQKRKNKKDAINNIVRNNIVNRRL